VTSVHVSAPGKLMVAGEYAVLHGAEALVVAVDRRVHARIGAGSEPRPPREAEAARREAELLAGPATGSMSIDVTALRSPMIGGQPAGALKLGLGSSAAAAAAGAGVVLAYHGQDVGADDVRARARAAALAGHGAVAPGGSGADVTASVLGGVLRYRMRDGVPVYASLRWPEDLHPVVVWTGTEARTSELVEAVDALGRRDAAAHQRAMNAVAVAAAAMVVALEAADAARVIAATEEHCGAMATLGRAAGAPIVDASHGRIAALARDAGGAAKPSGAGGGDVALALFVDPGSAAHFGRACQAEGFTLLSLTFGAPGLLRHDLTT